jgi:hypothetical protein
MTRFYQPDLSTDLHSPFVRDGKDKLIRRSYWLDMDDRTLVMVMVDGIGANLTNEEKRAHLTDLRREHSLTKSVFKKSFRPRNKHELVGR